MNRHHWRAVVAADRHIPAITSLAELLRRRHRRRTRTTIVSRALAFPDSTRSLRHSTTLPPVFLSHLLLTSIASSESWLVAWRLGESQSSPRNERATGRCPHFHELRGKAKSDDANEDATIHAANKRLQQEIRESRALGSPALLSATISFVGTKPYGCPRHLKLALPITGGR